MNSKQLNDRLVRIESRLVQIMLHLGMNPYQKMYDDNQAKHYRDQGSTGADPQSSLSTQGKPE